uniref:Uncharacterized protein n=1 Tax=Setaria italica TaxID=4555 RepID=K3ZDV5_SETIT
MELIVRLHFHLCFLMSHSLGELGCDFAKIEGSMKPINNKKIMIVFYFKNGVMCHKPR